jgi:hypothetical protein
MSIRFSTDSQRAKVLKALHRDASSQSYPLSRESIDFLFEYIETLETEIERSTDRFGPEPPLADHDPYYMARATAGLKHSST